MRHIFVMQSEMENEIDYEDMKYSADKYSKAFNSHNAQRDMRAKKEAERKNFRSDSEPYFRPAQRPSATNSKQKTKPPRVAANEQQSQNNDVLLDNMIKSNVDAIVGDSRRKEDNFTSTSPAVPQKTTKLTSVLSSSTTPSSTTHSKDELVSESVDKIASKKNDEESTADKVVLNLFNNISSALSSTTAASSTSSSTSAAISDDEDGKEELSSTSKDESIVSNTLETVKEEIEAEALNDLEQIAASVGETIAETDAIDRNNSKEPQTTTTETQLFQDTVHKEKEPVPVVNRRGV